MKNEKCAFVVQRKHMKIESKEFKACLQEAAYYLQPNVCVAETIIPGFPGTKKMAEALLSAYSEIQRLKGQKPKRIFPAAMPKRYR